MHGYKLEQDNALVNCESCWWFDPYNDDSCPGIEFVSHGCCPKCSADEYLSQLNEIEQENAEDMYFLERDRYEMLSRERHPWRLQYIDNYRKRSKGL